MSSARWRDLWKPALKPRVGTLTGVSMLINKGRFKDAYLALRGMSIQDRGSAHYWMQRGLVELLLGYQVDATHSYNKARTCEDYKPEHEGDALRDTALFLIRRGRLHEAGEKLTEALPYHQTEDRPELLRACDARLAMASGWLNAAARDFEEALSSWEQRRHDGLPYNDQWVMNARFHYFRLLVQRGDSEATEVGHTILRTDPNRTRRLRVRLMLRGGKLGGRIDNVIMGRLLRKS